MRLRDVELGDVDAYVRMRCDPVMTAELGGPLPREGIEDKVARDVQAVAAGTDWIKMILPGEAAPDVVAGSVTLWSHDEDSEPVSEIGWMVLPEFQGRGLAKRAVRVLLELLRRQVPVEIDAGSIRKARANEVSQPPRRRPDVRATRRDS